MEVIALNGRWQMKAVGEQEKLGVTIPGSVLSCLLEHGKIEDPYYRDNEFKTRDLFWKDYLFERDFEISESILESSDLDLVCFGLDTITEITINGQYIANTNNMHSTYRFSVKKYLILGKNHIEVLCKSPLRYIEQVQPAPGKEIRYDTYGAMEGNQYVRKAHSMFGWDWGPQLIDAGIWRDIQIEAYEKILLSHVDFKQQHENEQKCVMLSGKISLMNDLKIEDLDDAYSVKNELFSPDGDKIHEVEGMDFSFNVDNPKLWWPNGFGEHPLYKVVVTLQKNGIEEQKLEYSIGLRTLTVRIDKDEWGNEFAFEINGIKIFAMGADYIPEDCVYSRITKERVQYLIDSCIRANYNCIRVWGGGYYPTDDFYDMCDQAGLLVWQDLMYACNIYDFTDEFADTIKKETIDNVRRLKHHASLALWCGNNELESAWDHWEDFKKQTPYLRADYIKQFEDFLPKLVKKEDPETFYWNSSPSSGGCFDDPDDENRGDTHYWAVWHGQKPFTDYQKYFFRFCSEFGFQSFPGIKTINTFTEKEDRNIFSHVMESHQKNDSANGKIMFYLAATLRNPKNFDSLLYDSQILQAIAIKSGVEHWRRNRGRCMGALYWQLNDNWPVASWSSIDYFGRWKALHYLAAGFFAPIAGSIKKNLDEDTCMRNGDHFSSVSIYVQNETLSDQMVDVEVYLRKIDGQIIDQYKTSVKVDSLSAKKVCDRDYTSLVKRQPRISVSPEKMRAENLESKDNVYVEALFTYEDGHVQREIETLLPYKHINLPVANITTLVKEEIFDGEEGYQIKVTTDQFAVFIMLDFEDADVIFSDNYFTLPKGETKNIRLNKKDIFRGKFKDAKDIENRLLIRSLRDTY